MAGYSYVAAVWRGEDRCIEDEQGLLHMLQVNDRHTLITCPVLCEPECHVRGGSSVNSVEGKHKARDR